VYHRQYNGIWEMKGYGFAFKMNHGFAKTFEVTNTYYCEEPSYNGIIIGKAFFSGIGKFQVKKVKNKLFLMDLGSQITYELVKQEANYFEHKTQVKSGMQVEKFEMFYEMFKENYAFQSLYNANIKTKYETIKSDINEKVSNQQLFAYMKDLVSELEDGHVSVNWNDKSYCPKDYLPNWFTDKEQLNLLSEVLINHYVKDYKKFEDCLIRYGYLSDDTGYVVIHGMGVEAFDKSGSTKKAMDEIIKTYNEKGIKKMVIELRFNSGGFDEASLCIAGYFTKKSYKAYSKQFYANGKYTKLQDVYVKPQKLNFEGEVYILTSGYTISAAETFLRAMRANPELNVLIIGEKTAGFYSDAINRSLPDGFSYSLSNELYYGIDDTLFEGQGIKPDIILPISMASVYEGKEESLEWILRNK